MRFMSSIVSLKRNADFRRLYSRGRSAVSATVVVYAARNRCGVNRLGLTAGKKVGCAARRNRAKRRLRALYRKYILSGEVLPPNNNMTFDFVVVARAGAVDRSFDALSKDFKETAAAALKQICVYR